MGFGALKEKTMEDVDVALATVADPAPHGGSYFRCDKHARAPTGEWEDDPQQSYPTHAAAALRRLQELFKP